MRKNSSLANDGWDDWQRLSDLEGTPVSPGTKAIVEPQDRCVWAGSNVRALHERRRTSHRRWRRFGETVLAIAGTYLLLMACAMQI